VIVGTHADKLKKTQDCVKVSEEVLRKYPIYNSPHARNQVHGHYTLSITSGILLEIIFFIFISMELSGDIQGLRDKLVEVAATHPKIGIGKVEVPRSFAMLQHELQERRHKGKQYLSWNSYAQTAESIGIYTVQGFFFFFFFLTCKVLAKTKFKDLQSCSMTQASWSGITSPSCEILSSLILSG